LSACGDPIDNEQNDRCSVPSTSWFCASDIYVMNGDGTGQHKLIRTRTRRVDQQDRDPVWSPNGQEIAFWREAKHGRPEIRIANANGTGERLLTQGDSPSWSPDGQHLVFQGRDGLFVIGVDGRGLRRLTHGGGAPDWSPDGRLIVFIKFDGHRTSLRLIRSDGTGERLLTPTSRATGSHPEWSPNGNRIVDSKDSPGGRGFILNARGYLVRRLELPFYHGDPAWSPDGRKLIFSAPKKGYEFFDLYVMNTNGTARHRLTRTRLDEGDADWTR
jgi:Tol biopolymer transport system component